MAIANLLPAGGANDNRPNLKQFFGKNPAVANDNVERVSSGMFSNAFVDSVVTTLQGLVQEIAKISDIAKSVIASFGAIVKSIKELNKDVTSRFRVLNNELNASKIDFIRTVLAIPKTEAPVKIDGVPVNVNAAPEAAKKEDKGFDLTELLASFLGGGIAKGAIQGMLRGLMSFAVTVGLPMLQTVASFFTGALGGPLLIAALTGWGLYKVMGGMIDDYNKKLGITPDMSQDQIEGIKRAYQGERKEAPYREGANMSLLMQQIIAGERDEELGLNEPGMTAKKAEEIRQKVAGDLGRRPPVIDPRLKNLPEVKTRAERKSEAQSGSQTPPPPGTPTPAAPTGASPPAAPAGASPPPGSPTPAEPPAPPAPPANPTKGMTPAERSRYNRDQAAKELAGGPSGTVKTDSNVPPPPAGSPSGAPAATSMSPPPAGPSIADASNSGGVAVIQNSSTQNVGTTAGAENGGMTGQNLPMFARNPKLQSTFSMQTPKYQ